MNKNLKYMFVAFTALLFNINSYAVDAKILPGIACQKSLGVGSYGGGAIRNDSTTGSLTVECPIVRDIVSGELSAASVRIYNATNSASACLLHTKSVYGTKGFSQYKANGTSGYKKLKFGAMNDHNNGAYYFWCAISPSQSNANKSKLISYRWDEK